MAGSTLEDGFRKLRELTDAATLNALADPSMEASPAAASAGGSRYGAPTVDQGLLNDLRTICGKISCLHPPSAAWVGPLVRHGIVPTTAALLQHLLQAYRSSPGSFRAAPAATELGGGPQASALRSALLSVRTAAVLLDNTAEAFFICVDAAADASSSHPGGFAAEAAERAAAVELWGQLAAPATLQALADTVRWVEAEVWPAERAAAGTAEAVDAANGCQLTEHACEVLSSAATVVRYVAKCSGLQPAAGSLARGALSSSSAAAAASAARQQALLAGLKDSGLLSALSAAVLAAPPCPEVAPDATALDPAVTEMATAQDAVFSTLHALRCVVTPSGALDAVSELLAAPDVQRLRWDALEQLAAIDPPAAAAAAAWGSSSVGGRDGGGGVARERWLLLQPHVVRLAPELGGRLAFPCVRMLGAVVNVPMLWTIEGKHTAGGGVQPLGQPARLAAAAKLLPPPRRLAALAAACSRALCREVEAGLAAAAAEGGGPGGGGDSDAAAELGEMLCELARVAYALSPADKCAPDVLEATAWVLKARTAALALGQRHGDGIKWRPPALDADCLAGNLLRMMQGSATLNTAAQAARAQRLLPTGLMQSLDRLLRWWAAAEPQLQRRSHTGDLCQMLMFYLLPDMLRACPPLALDAGSAGGGGGGGAWRPQDELGLLVTAAKLARREAEAAQACTASPLTPQAMGCDYFVSGAAFKLRALLDEPPSSTERGPAGPGGRAGAPGGPRDATLAVATREAATLAFLSSLPALEFSAARALDCPGGGSAGANSSGAGRGPGSATTDTVADCYNTAAAILQCLTANMRLLPAADLLALRPQRTLALLGRLLQRAHELRRPGAGQGGRGSGRRRSEAGRSEDERKLTSLAGEVVLQLVRMAANEQLVGAVAGWLRGEALAAGAEGRPGGQQQQQQQQPGGLDARVLAAALRPWDDDAANIVESVLVAAAAAGASAAAPAPGVAARAAGDTSGRGSQAATSGGGDAAPLLAAARAVIARHPRGLSDHPAHEGVGVAPAWPPRVLRLCGNAGCRNFAGPSEAALPLRKCSGCEAVRYCGAGCQRQHWREGGHKEACARLRMARETREAANG